MYAITPPGRGRRPAIITYGIPRQLEEPDIARLWEGGAGNAGFSRIKSLRYNHHMLAKAVASGRSLLECSQLTGLNISRISDLKNDPAFQELVSFYADELHQVFVNVHERMATLGTSVLEELQERFETTPESFTKRELMELFTTVADRSIPTAKGGPSPQANTGGGGANLALQINFVSPQGQQVETIEAEALSAPTPAPATITVEAPTPASLPGASPLPNESSTPDPSSAPAEPEVVGAPRSPLHTEEFAATLDELKRQAAERNAAKRAEEAKARDRLRATYLAQKK